MQIRKQLRAMANALATDSPANCPDQEFHLGSGKVCRLGYFHSKYSRFRHKSRTPHNRRGSGTAPRHTKKKGGGAGQ